MICLKSRLFQGLIMLKIFTWIWTKTFLCTRYFTKCVTKNNLIKNAYSTVCYLLYLHQKLNCSCTKVIYNLMLADDLCKITLLLPSVILIGCDRCLNYGNVYTIEHSNKTTSKRLQYTQPSILNLFLPTNYYIENL